MDRRTFLTALAVAAPALAFDPERALWVPGQRTYVDLARSARDPEIHLSGIGGHFDAAGAETLDHYSVRVSAGRSYITYRARSADASALEAAFLRDAHRDIAFVAGRQWPDRTMLTKGNGKWTVEPSYA